jgi:hypothetical protein
VGTVADALRAAATQAALEAERGTLIGPGMWQRVHPEGVVLTVAADKGLLVCDIACPGLDPADLGAGRGTDQPTQQARAGQPAGVDVSQLAAEEPPGPPEWTSTSCAQPSEPAPVDPPPSQQRRWLSTDVDLRGWQPLFPWPY